MNQRVTARKNEKQDELFEQLEQFRSEHEGMTPEEVWRSGRLDLQEFADLSTATSLEAEIDAGQREP